MYCNRWIVIAAILAANTTASLLRADDTADTINRLKQHIEELDQKVRVLERKGELDQEAAADQARTASSVSAGAGGFMIRSADTNFVLKLRGYAQADSRFYPDDHSAGTANDTFLLRRVRPILEGTVFDTFDFRLMLDFGSGSGTSSTAGNVAFVQDAYATARLWPEFQIQAGKFKEPVGLERLQSGANLLFVERGLPTQLLPNRDVGVQLQGEVWSGTLHYAAGVFNGTADGGSADIESADDDRDFAGRIFVHPFKTTTVDGLKGLGLGLAGTYGNQDGALRTFVSPGQQRFFTYLTSTTGGPNVVADGPHWRLSPQGYYYWGPFGLFGEYAISSQKVRQAGGGAGAGTFATFRHKAWQVAASYFLTGEQNSWKAVTPRKPFGLGQGQGWGAWEIAGRIGELDVDEDVFPGFASPTASASQAFSWGVGLNWHLNKNIKLNLDYEQTDFKGGAGDLLNQGEKVILTRAQFSF
jgi:phosphate-selective porin OprO/OprP